MPIATTPAAEPNTNILPPVPAAKAIACQRGSSTPCENMPILAATRGTLSMTAEPEPSNATTTSIFGNVAVKSCAKLNSKPNDSSAATAIKIPKKKRMLGNSILVNAL